MELTRHAACQLPAYLVPDAIVVLDGLPMTPNGKIDRGALSAITVPTGPTGRAPRTDAEKALCALFEEVLQLSGAGIETDFFAAGGNSLLAMRLVSRVRARMEYELSVRDVFDAPTVEALARLLKVRSAPGQALLRYQATGPTPLSAAQRRLWFINRLEGKTPAYNIPLSLRLRGRLDRAALWAALEDLVERHESLRTIFPEYAGEPCQQVLDTAMTCPSPHIVELGQADLEAYQIAFERQGFDLRTDAPLRTQLVALGEHEHVLLMVVHHIAYDGWSLAPLAKDLAAAYVAHAGGCPAELPPLALQYRDFTWWQRDMLGTTAAPESVISKQLSFWTGALQGLPDHLELPVDRPRLPRASYRGEVIDFTLSPELTCAIARFAADAGASSFMVVLTALAATLTKLGAGNDIPIGTPTAGRADEALDDLIGFFSNTLVLRTDSSGDPSFRELLGRVRENVFQAFAHQDLPFDVLVEALNPPRSLTYHPLFQTMLVFENNVSAQITIPGLEVIPERSRLGVARFDLVFSMMPASGPGADGGMECFVEYATDLFDRSTVQRIAGYLVTILGQGLATPDTPIGRIEVRSVDERHTVQAWNATARDVSKETLPRLFQSQVALTPDRPAVLCEDESMTFAELNARTNRLARHLVRLGAGPETVVALAMPRSLEMIVALWAVVKSGAAYLPVDLDYPAARISAMLGDANPALVLTTQAAAHRLPTGHALLCLDHAQLREELAAEDERDLVDDERREPLRPDHPLYLIYTSGSTGRPKGVLMPTLPIVNLLAWHASVMPAAPDSVTAQFASMSFDAAAQEILSAGTMGKTLAVPTDDIRRSPADLVRWLERYRVTELFAPSSLIEILCEEAQRQGRNLPHLRHVAQGGEALVLTPSVRSFFDATGARRLHNFYGPTESHAATSRTVDRPVAEQPASVPIGKPIWNTRIYLLDAGLRPVPLGVPGEVFIAGAGVARGYLNRPAETAQRFVPDPSGEPGSRMYRTGDLARWTAEGQLEFLGRNDFQVKIRGFRIELGEVEAVLRAAPGVAQAVALAASVEPVGKCLTCYVVPQQGAVLDTQQVKAFAGERLPGFMVPASVLVLDSLPLTPSGKVDRLALPAPVLSAAPVAREPRNELEGRLCKLIADALGLSAVGVTDNFFDMGGHSLLVTRLIDQMRTTLAMELPIRDFFDEPTAAGMARRMRRVTRVRPALRRKSERSSAPDRGPTGAARPGSGRQD